jgi:hypothetical protein
MGDSTNTMDVDLPWESAIHNYGFSLAISEDRIWQTGGVGSSNIFEVICKQCKVTTWGMVRG